MKKIAALLLLLLLAVWAEGADALILNTGPSQNPNVTAVNKGGTGLNTNPSNGQLLIGNTAQQGYNLATLTGGPGVTISNGPGSISISISGLATIATTGNAGDLVGLLSTSQLPSFTGGDVVSSGGTQVLTIQAGHVTNTMLAGGITAANLVGTDINHVGTLTAGATGSGFTIALGSSTISGALTGTNGGTGQTSISAAFASFFETAATTLGDLVYGGASGAPTRLAGNTTATKKFLRETGNGSNAAAPAWDTVVASDLPNAASDGTTKGVVTFNTTDFSCSSGVCDTIQAIASSSTPTFGGLTLNGTLAMGANNITMSGSLGATGTRLTKGWFTDLQVTNAIAGSVTGNAATATALANARTIGGTSFDGTANITVASATGGFAVTGGTLSASGLGTFATVDIGSTAAATTGSVLDISHATSSMILPTGTTAQRPTPTAGMLRYNSDTPGLEAYYSSTWNALGAGGGGGGTIGGGTGSTNNAILLASGTGGATIKGSLATIDTSGNINIPTGTNYEINGSQIAAANLSDGNSGTGNVVHVTSATLVTPTLGVASATSLAASGIGTFATVDIGSTAAVSTGTVLDMSHANTSMLLPTGTSGQRPTGIAGMCRYNSSTPAIECFYSSAWNTLGSGGGGGGASLSANNTWTAGQAVTPDTATSCGTQSAAGTMTPNFAISNSCDATFGAGNLTIANPTNVIAGQVYVIDLTQDATGGRTVTWGSEYKWGGATAPTLSTGGADVDEIVCRAKTTTFLVCAMVAVNAH